MPAVQQAREHRTNAKTRGDGLYSVGFSGFDCEPHAHEQLRYKTLLQNDQATGQYVMQRLLLFGKCRPEVTDIHDDARNPFSEKSSVGPRERNARPVEVGDDDSQRHFAETGLMAGTLHHGVIQPATDEESESNHHHSDSKYRSREPFNVSPSGFGEGSHR